MKLKQLSKLCLWVLLLLVFFVLVTNIWVLSSTKENIHTLNDPNEINVALVLGTSRWTVKGEENRFFRERMITAAELYTKGIVKQILVSGDNGTTSYNEPREMLN